MLIWPAKDPVEVLDFTWTPPLDSGDTIASHTATKNSGSVTKDSDTKTDTQVLVWLSGGVDGENSVFDLRVVTAQSRRYREVVVLPVFDRASELLALFRLRYAAFNDVADGVVGFWMQDAGRLATTDYGTDQDLLKLLLTAHNLTLQGLGSGTDVQRAGQFAGATRVKSGSLELAWDKGEKSTGSRYGDEAWAIIRSYQAGPRVTGTGALPYCAPGRPWAC